MNDLIAVEKIAHRATRLKALVLGSVSASIAVCARGPGI